MDHGSPVTPGMPDTPGTIERLERLVRPLLAAQGLDVVEVTYAGGRRRGMLRVFVDKIGGVTADECGRASEILSAALDVEDLIGRSYVLEVSSPGLDRPLAAPRDFQHRQGRLIRVETTATGVVTGRVRGADDEAVELDVKGAGPIRLSYPEIRSARVTVEWPHES